MGSAGCCFFLYVVVCCCLLLFVVVCCCLLLFVVVVDNRWLVCACFWLCLFDCFLFFLSLLSWGSFNRRQRTDLSDSHKEGVP